MGLWNYIKAELAVLRAAPFSFLGLMVISIAFGVGIGQWHFGERLEAKDTEIHRLRVALGIDKGGPNALAELSNAELRAKAMNSASKARDLCFSFQKRADQIKPPTPGNKKEGIENFDRVQALMKEVSESFDRDLKADFLNANNEVMRRLDRKAIASVVRGPIFSDAETGIPIGMASLTPGQFEAPFLCTYADQLEQMAKLLPSDSGQKP